MQKFRSILLLLFLFTTVAYSQQTTNTTIQGQLLDSLTSETVPYATIRISAKENPKTMLKGFATDENGKFKFNLNKKGDFLMTIQYIGKTDIIIPLTIDDRKKIDLGDLLMADNTQALNEVTITAQKPLVQVDIDKIVYDVEEDPESKTDNLLDMLRKVPLITVDGEDNIQLKGSSDYKIYVDGKPSSMISSNPKDVLRSMPANSVKNIEVITDPGAKYDAEGVAGIINIITNKQSRLGGYTATLSGGVDNRGGYNGSAYTTMKYGKVGFTANFGRYDRSNPWSFSSKVMETYNPVSSALSSSLIQRGSRKGEGNGQYGSGELSYEIDTLNLITVGFNRYSGNFKSRINQEVTSFDGNMLSEYAYSRGGKSKNEYGSTTINADYQRSFRKKGQLLTISYRLDIRPDDSESNTDIAQISGVLPTEVVSNYQHTDADMKEHTFQGDFTTPFGKIHTIEAGFKYIIRNNKSNSGRYNWDSSQSDWVHDPKPLNDRFRHESDIFATYAGYSAKIQKWGFKTGLRYESTDLKAKFPLQTTANFKTDYENWVPSITMSYQLKPAQTIRAGYNMRIYRPSIWQLNPYEDDSNPNFINRGNPSLDAVKNHSFNLNYMFFNSKININLNSTYSFENNNIQNYTFLENGTSVTTYDNIGENKRFNLSSYINWSITSKLRFTTNIWGSYTDVKANNNTGERNHGFSVSGYGNIQYTLPKSFRVGSNGGYFGSHVSLQGKNSPYYYYGINLSKGFLSDKLNVNIWSYDIFQTDKRSWYKINTDSFRQKETNDRRARSFGVRVSYRFGEMKTQIKKAQRTIQNDDMMGGGGSDGGQQGGQ